MAIKAKFYGIARNGRFVPANPERIAEYLRGYQDGQELEIAVSKKYKRRTSGQPDELTNFNGYYHAVIVKMVAEQIGELDLDYVHHWIQMKAGNTKQMPDGTVLPKGTRYLSGGEFAEFCSKARMWANQYLGLIIPEPNEIIHE